MLRKLTLVLAMLATTLPGAAATAAPDMQTLTLNTGYDHDKQGPYAVGPTDSFWAVIQDPVSGPPEPRPANTITKHPAWAVAQPASQWISYSSNGSQGILKGAYFYQKCFCLTRAMWDNPEAVQQSVLSVSVRADDAFHLGLNTVPNPSNPSTYILSTTAGGGGGFMGNPAVLSLKGDKLLKLLQPGRNCLTVRVEDIGTVITGFNLAGSLTVAGVDGIAKVTAPNPAPQFNTCSSCSRRRIEHATDVRSAVREGAATPPED